MAKKSALSKPVKDFISSKIKKIMYEYDKTGMIGKSKPANRNAALRQAIAVAFSMAKREGFKVPKKAEEYDLDKMNSMTMVEKIFITSAIGLCFLVGNKRE